MARKSADSSIYWPKIGIPTGSLAIACIVAASLDAAYALATLALDFTGYPSGNEGVAITQLGRVQCTSSAYHHAAARVRAVLTDASDVAYDVTDEAGIVSGDGAAVSPVGSRMVAVGTGVALISATFGASGRT